MRELLTNLGSFQMLILQNEPIEMLIVEKAK